MSIKETILDNIRLVDEVKGVKVVLKEFKDKLEHVDKRLVRIETIVNLLKKAL